MELLRAIIVVFAFLHALVNVTARLEAQVQQKQVQFQASAQFQGSTQFQTTTQSQTQVQAQTQVQQPQAQPHKQAQGQTQTQPQPQGQTQKPVQGQTPAQPQEQVFIPKTQGQQNQQGLQPPTQGQQNQQGLQPPTQGQQNQQGMQLPTQGQQKQRGSQPPTPGQPQAPMPYDQITLHDMYNAIAAAKPQAYLAAHNLYRQQHGVPPLQWNKTLENYAFNYACKRAKDCIMKHSYGQYGENLYWEQYEESTPAQVVQSFMAEQKNYDIKTGNCNCQENSGKCMCGHYTAVIWKTTERVGCAEVKCDAEKGKLIVCSYDPPGNRVGEHPLNIKQ